MIPDRAIRRLQFVADPYAGKVDPGRIAVVSESDDRHGRVSAERLFTLECDSIGTVIGFTIRHEDHVTAVAGLAGVAATIANGAVVVDISFRGDERAVIEIVASIGRVKRGLVGGRHQDVKRVIFPGISGIGMGVFPELAVIRDASVRTAGPVGQGEGAAAGCVGRRYGEFENVALLHLWCAVGGKHDGVHAIARELVTEPAVVDHGQIRPGLAVGVGIAVTEDHGCHRITVTPGDASRDEHRRTRRGKRGLLFYVSYDRFGRTDVDTVHDARRAADHRRGKPVSVELVARAIQAGMYELK